MNNPNIPIEEYFRYHPPTTQERKDKHDLINTKALQLALAIDQSVADPQCKQFAIFAVQQARMFANQGITVDDLSERNQPHL